MTTSLIMDKRGKASNKRHINKRNNMSTQQTGEMA